MRTRKPTRKTSGNRLVASFDETGVGKRVWGNLAWRERNPQRKSRSEGDFHSFRPGKSSHSRRSAPCVGIRPRVMIILPSRTDYLNSVVVKNRPDRESQPSNQVAL